MRARSPLSRDFSDKEASASTLEEYGSSTSPWRRPEWNGKEEAIYAD